MKPTPDEKNHLVTQIEGLCGTRPMFYLKFCSCEQFASDICNGNLYANTPEYFREQERRSGERGQGDQFELISVIESFNITMCDAESGNIILSSPKGTVKIRYKDDDSIPLVSFTGITLREMDFIEADEKHADCVFPFTDDEYERMEEKFGKYCVIIAAREIEQKIEQYCKTNNCDYIFDRIDYCSQSRIDRLQAFGGGTKERFLYKNEDLAYQREYRLAMALEMPLDHFIRIGKLDNAKVLEAKELKNMAFRIEYSCKEKK